MKKEHEIDFSKMLMREDVALVMHHLHFGNRPLTDQYLNDLKTHAVEFNDQIQQDVLIFSEQVMFQYDYDPSHRISPEIQGAADQLLKDLG